MGYAQRLRELANELQAISREMMGQLAVEPVRTAEEAGKLLSQRRCLNCGNVVPAKDNYRRGLDDACYQSLLARKRAGEVTDSELVSAGIMAPATKGGRPARSRSKINEYLAARKPIAQAAIQAGDELHAAGLAKRASESGQTSGQPKRRRKEKA